MFIVNPLATALMTRMQVAPNERRQVKLAGLQTLLGKPLNPRRRRLLSQMLDLYLPLPVAERQELAAELATLQPPKEGTNGFANNNDTRGRLCSARDAATHVVW
jgi:hypothetical protein